MRHRIFYSWQSDLPDNTNRGLLQDAIMGSVEAIHRDLSIDLVDRDSQALAGSAGDPPTLIEKIKASDVFIADVSTVTGDMDKNMRLSPNPDVLLELGYAIGFLGCDKIILICNTINGEDAKLPCDVQQLKKISYRLCNDEPKSSIRNRMVSELKEELADILNIKPPELSIGWVCDVCKDANAPTKEKEVDVLEVHQAKHIDEIEEEAMRGMEAIDAVDGSMDPDWASKVTTFKDECDAFLKHLKTDDGKNKYLFGMHSVFVTYCGLIISNTGGMPATDVRVVFSMPEWLIIFDRWPDDIPKIPELPRPTSPDELTIERELQGGAAVMDPFAPSLLKRRTSGNQVRDGEVTFWVDELMHKHGLYNHLSIFMLAKPDAAVGIHDIRCRLSYAESGDWRDVDLKLQVKAVD
jgi:hypothetical protein